MKLDGGGVKSLIKSPCLPHRSCHRSRTQHDIGKCEGQKCPGNIETLLQIGNIFVLICWTFSNVYKSTFNIQTAADCSSHGWAAVAM